MQESKRDQLIQRALEVFYEGGFHAVGMERLAKETGVSKTAIYKHFRSKEELILATLRLRDERFREWMIRRIDELAEAPAEKLIAVFDVLSEWFAEPAYRSCMFIKASSEYQDRDHPIHAMSAEHKRLLRIYFCQLSESAGAQDPSKLAGQILTLKEGAIVLAHLLGGEGVVNDAKSAAQTLVSAACGK